MIASGWAAGDLRDGVRGYVVLMRALEKGLIHLEVG